MADIRLDIDSVLANGMDVTFKAPCDCTSIDGLKVYYIKDRETHNMRFVFKDTHGNELTGIGNLFEEGAYVRVILDTTNGFAYIQNADTNGYIESRINAAFDKRYDNPIVVGKTDTGKKVYRVRKKYSVTAEIYERTPVAHNITCSDIWLDAAQSFCTVASSDMFLATDRIPILCPNLTTIVDDTNIVIWQALSDQEIVFDVVIYYVEV